MNKIHPGLIDLHNHTLFSDGTNSIKQIIDNALNFKVDILGISDHIEKIKDYNYYINSLDVLIKEYKGRIRILKGVEIEAKTFIKLSKEDIFELNKLDYILIEDCEYRRSIDEFIDTCNLIFPRVKPRIGLAHVGLQRIVQRFGNKGLHKLFRFLEKNNVFWEINANESNRFYDDLLYNDNIEVKNIINEIKNYNIEISVGSDTHELSSEFYYRLLRGNELADVIVKMPKK